MIRFCVFHVFLLHNSDNDPMLKTVFGLHQLLLIMFGLHLKRMLTCSVISVCLSVWLSVCLSVCTLPTGEINVFIISHCLLSKVHKIMSTVLTYIFPIHSKSIPVRIKNLTKFHGPPLDSSHTTTGVMCPWHFVRSNLVINVHRIARPFKVSYETLTVQTTVALGKATTLVTFLWRRLSGLEMEKCRPILQHISPYNSTGGFLTSILDLSLRDKTLTDLSSV